MNWMFKLRGDLSKNQSVVLAIIGVLIFLAIWFLLTLGENPFLPPAILPSPGKVFAAYPKLIDSSDLFKNTFFSIGLNMAGYVKAIFFSVLIGFVVGLYPLFRGLFRNHIDAIRFIPLAAMTGLFIKWYGVNTSMKVAFLAFGIIIYLLPVIVQRIDEVKDVYLKTVYTLGASDLWTIRTVYFPSVMSRLFDDIRILTAISWTYIIVVETINANSGGIGTLIYNARRFARMDELFALIILIILIGVIQDQIFKYLDKEFFPHKYQIKNKHSADLQEPSLMDNIFDFGFNAFVWILLALYLLLVVMEYTGLGGGFSPLSHFFGGTLWVIHLTFLSIVAYKGSRVYNKITSKSVVANG
jgi:ABC-type nitrate/sulfonate/bicarbonate transport system permease component